MKEDCDVFKYCRKVLKDLRETAWSTSEGDCVISESESPAVDWAGQRWGTRSAANGENGFHGQVNLGDNWTEQ